MNKKIIEMLTIRGCLDSINTICIKGVLGEGSTADVLLGKDLHQNTLVAVKRLKKDYQTEAMLARLRNEAKLLLEFHHPHIVPFVDFIKHRGQWHLFMELLPEGSLRDYLTVQKQIELNKALNIARDIAMGLDQLHRNNIYHRDLKPANILKDKNKFRLADLGLAKDARLTLHAGQNDLYGTPIYWSPFQLEENREDFLERNDNWALGIILIEMLTGKVPFNTDSIADVIHDIQHKEILPLNKMGVNLPALERLIARILMRDPTARPPTALGIANEIQRIQRSRKDPHATMPIFDF